MPLSLSTFFSMKMLLKLTCIACCFTITAISCMSVANTSLLSFRVLNVPLLLLSLFFFVGIFVESSWIIFKLFEYLHFFVNSLMDM